jgi:hypothetical protein
MKIFISWSKDKSRLLALETKNFIQKVLGNDIDVFFSPDMYKGTSVDNEIHNNLLESDRCIVCITSDNFKNPWLMYEAGVVYGAHFLKPGKSIVIPILFEHIPDWSSWVDKPLNRYVPIRLDNENNNFKNTREDFKCFLQELADEVPTELKNFSKYWKIYIDNVVNILQREQMIPNTCRDLVDQIMKDNYGNFTITSPEITREHILFHKGFSTNVLTRILIRNVIDYQGKRLWFYGRRNKKIFTGENDDFFNFLANEGLNNGVDFKCLFPHPNSEAMTKAVSKDKERRFIADLQTSLEAAVRMKNRFHLPINEMFRLYKRPRKESIIISDNAVLYSPITCDSEGYPLQITNSSFEIIGISESDSTSRGNVLYDAFMDVWNQSIPLTEELYNELYDIK